MTTSCVGTTTSSVPAAAIVSAPGATSVSSVFSDTVFFLYPWTVMPRGRRQGGTQIRKWPARTQAPREIAEFAGFLRRSVPEDGALRQKNIRGRQNLSGRLTAAAAPGQACLRGLPARTCH